MQWNGFAGFPFGPVPPGFASTSVAQSDVPHIPRRIGIPFSPDAVEWQEFAYLKKKSHGDAEKHLQTEKKYEVFVMHYRGIERVEPIKHSQTSTDVGLWLDDDGSVLFACRLEFVQPKS